MRSEVKYLVPMDDLAALRARIAPFVHPDPHIQSHEHYTVRSIYFDTLKLRYYHEKLDGLKVRKKLRIRAYNQPSDAARAFLEIKHKVESKTRKERVAVPVHALGSLLQTGVPDPVLDAGLSEQARTQARHFFYTLHRHALRAIVLVVYEREPYVGTMDASLRITFDQHLRSGLYPALDDLYREHGLTPALPDHFILEVKFDGAFPFWLRGILGHWGLRQRALSKYVLCLDTHPPGRVHQPAAVLAFSRPLTSSGSHYPG